MKRLAVWFFFLLIAAAWAAPQNEGPKADLVLRHGRVYTMDAARSWAESVAISKGRIVYAGPDRGIQEWIGKDTQTMELGGRYVMPSFIDSHVHPLEAGISLNQLVLDEMTTKEEILDGVKQYAAAHTDAKWILGGGWSLPIFPAANPQKEWLDALVPDRPVLLGSADGHSAWANSKALELAHVTKDTPDPVGGRIERNAQGEPSGTLRESAVDLVDKVAPSPTPEERIAGLKKAVGIMNHFGITGFNDASLSEDGLIAYTDADRRGVLTARVAGSIYANPDGSLEQVLGQVKTMKAWREKYRTANFRATTVKIFEDGVIEANTAAMLQPYLDRNGDAGKLLWEAQILNPFVELIDREGFQVHFHAIGDRAVRTALDALEAAQKTNGIRDGRPFLAHIEVIDPADIPRFVKIGASPCFQPLWSFEDDYITDLTKPKMAQERWQWIYPIESVERTGAVVSMGSDWNVSSVNPLEGIEVAVTRRAPGDAPDRKPTFLPEQRIDVAEGLAAYTIGSAWTNFWDKETGTIETGKSADLIVLSDNPFNVNPEKLSDIKVLITLFKGKPVYRDPEWK